MSKDNWVYYAKDKMFCKVHNHLFLVGGVCEKCVPNTSSVGKQANPIQLFNQFIPNHRKGVVSKSSERTNAYSERQIKAYEWFKKEVSYMTIARRLKCSKSTAFSYVRTIEGAYIKHKGMPVPNDKSIPNARTYKGNIRLHNDSVSFLIQPIDLSMERNVVKLKYDKYKLIKTESEHIQIFSKKLIVRFLKDIEADTEKDCKALADQRITIFLSTFSLPYIKFLNDSYEQVSRHYAIIGTDLAKHFIKEKKKIIVLNQDNKGVRATIDFSHNIPELEFENAKLSGNDVNVWQPLIKDSLEKPIDMLSTTKIKTDLLINDFKQSKDMLLAYTEQIRLHLEVMQQMKETLKKIEEKMK
jgi:hypothetical protein